MPLEVRGRRRHVEGGRGRLHSGVFGGIYAGATRIVEWIWLPERGSGVNGAEMFVRGGQLVLFLWSRCGRKTTPRPHEDGSQNAERVDRGPPLSLRFGDSAASKPRGPFALGTVEIHRRRCVYAEFIDQGGTQPPTRQRHMRPA